MAERGGGRGGKISSCSSLKIFWFSLKISQDSSEVIKKVEGLFIENR